MGTNPRPQGKCGKCERERRLQARGLCGNCYWKDQGYAKKYSGDRAKVGLCSNCFRDMRLAQHNPALCQTCYGYNRRHGEPRPTGGSGMTCWSCKLDIKVGARYVRDLSQAEDYHPRCFDTWTKSLGNYETRIRIDTACPVLSSGEGTGT